MKKKKRQISRDPPLQLEVNGILLPERLTPAELLSAVFECLWNSGIEYRSIDNLKQLYCNILQLIADVCENNREYKRGHAKGRLSCFVTLSKKKRVRVTKIVRHLRCEEERCRVYLLTEIYNEVLKGYKFYETEDRPNKRK